MENTLHARTPARPHAGQTSTLLGNAPAGTLPNTLAAHTRYAFTLVSSLLGVGISAFLNQRSGILDLTSPNAKRPTLRPTISPFARRSYSSTNHNIRESITLATLDYSSIHPALQADLRPIHEKAPCEKKLVDGSTLMLRRQKRLLGALNDILHAISSLYSPRIHNYQLSFNSLDFGAAANSEQTEQWCQTSEANRKQPKRLPCSAFALTRNLLACLLDAVYCRTVTNQPRRPASKPGVFKYMCVEFKGVSHGF